MGLSALDSSFPPSSSPPTRRFSSSAAPSSPAVFASAALTETRKPVSAGEALSGAGRPRRSCSREGEWRVHRCRSAAARYRTAAELHRSSRTKCRGNHRPHSSCWLAGWPTQALCATCSATVAQGPSVHSDRRVSWSTVPAVCITAVWASAPCVACVRSALKASMSSSTCSAVIQQIFNSFKSKNKETSEKNRLQIKEKRREKKREDCQTQVVVHIE